MQITKTEVELTASDLMSIVEEYIRIPDLNLNEIDIDKFISIKGNYKAGVRLSFDISISLLSYNEDSITMKLEKIKVGKVGFFSWLQKFTLNKLITKLNLRGITSDKNNVVIEIKKIMDMLPFSLNLDLIGVDINKNKVDISVKNIKFSMKKEEQHVTKVALSVLENSNAIEDKIIFNQNKTEDSYTKVRKNIEDKIPSKYDKLLEYAFILPDIISLFYRLFKDKRVPLKTKVIIGSVLGYLASPIDIIPDFMPFIGKIDDLALAFYALNKAINEVPANIIIENWQGDFKAIKKIQAGIKYVNKATGGSNVDKLFEFVEKVYEFSKEDKIEHVDNYKKENL